MMTNRCVYLLSICALLAAASDDGKQYKDGEKVNVYVNKVGPYANPHETYHYYQLPVCRPEQVVHKRLTLGEVLDGDRMAESMYDIKFKENKPKTQLCTPFVLKTEERQKLAHAIEENFYFEFVVDDVPVRNFVGRLEEEGLFPHTHKVYVFTHHHFEFEYNGKNIINVRVIVEKEPPVRLDTDDNSGSNSVAAGDAGAAGARAAGASAAAGSSSASGLQIGFTYSAEWKETAIKYEERAKLQTSEDSFFPRSLEIHWLSVMNSSLLVFLLIGFVALILARIIRRDLSKYNSSSNDGRKQLESMTDDVDNGWKVVHGDVFRIPKNANLLCAILGVGCQLLSIIVTILLIVLLRLINVHSHGLINVTVVILYALTSFIAGYVSASWYKRFNGQKWVWNINLTSLLFSGPTFLIWCVENSFSWAYDSTQALPVTTVILLLALWICVGYPLTVIGGVSGKNFAGEAKVPCRVRKIARELPPLPWYHSCPAYCLVGGFLPFSAISVELYYIFATLWGRENYTLFGILLIIFAILLSVSACVSVALTYFQLTAEDYRWWWRCTLVGGSTGFFVFAYSVFYYVQRSEMTGALQTIQFFGYVGLICYGFFLCLATVAFFASYRFVQFLYASVKTD